MIIGTAGHIDHGKTALVRALTGIDTDRLPEERRRGITIELGFAPLALEGGVPASMVDVPGHEAFVRTMVAGATGVDLALLVVAADEGVMPQTREHLAILSLLGIRAGVIALTKCDMVDSEWLELARADVVQAVRGTALAEAPIVATSTVTGEGIAELRAALAAAVAAIPARDAADLFRMPVDRAFSVRGAGTVVTGTIWSGRVARDDTVVLHPGGRELRVRGVQSHGKDVDAAGPATRAAIALANIDVSSVERGAWLVSGTHWAESKTLRADVALLAGTDPPLRPREWVRLHLGTADVGARVVAPGGVMFSGELRAARVVLDQPIIARSGDRFVLRRASPASTIGGGIIVDPHPPQRRARPWPLAARDAGTRLTLLLRETGGAGLDPATLPIRLGLRPADVASFLANHSEARTIAGRLFDAAIAEATKRDVEMAVEAFHSASPLEPGMTLAALRARFPASPDLVEWCVMALVREGRLTVHGAQVSRPGWRPTLSPTQERLRAALLTALTRGGAEPPSATELAQSHSGDVSAILRLLEREGEVVAVEEGRYYETEALRRLTARLRDGMTEEREYSPAELRELLGLSRKYLIPFLEYCDQQRITERRSTGRVLQDARCGK